MDLYGNFAAYCTKHWCKSFVSTLSCFLCHFGTHFLERSAERARCILEYVWIASIFRVMREWFPYNRLQIFTIAPIVRIELEAIQAIVIVPIPIVRVVSVVSVVFPYDRPDSFVLFWDDWDDRDRSWRSCGNYYILLRASGRNITASRDSCC